MWFNHDELGGRKWHGLEEAIRTPADTPRQRQLEQPEEGAKAHDSRLRPGFSSRVLP